MLNFLNRKFGGSFKLYMPLLVGVITVICFVIGTFLDLQITEAAYIGKNFWSEFIEFGGTIPTALAVSLAGIFLYYFFENKDKTFWKYFFLILFIILSGGFWGFDTFHRHTELGFISEAYFYLPLGILLITVLDIPFVLLFRGGDSSKYLNKALVIIFATIVTLAVTFIIKGFNARARYMWIQEDYAMRIPLYTNWYQFSTDKTAYQAVDMNLVDFSTQSWPSGHSSFACLTSLFILLCDDVHVKLNGKNDLFFACVVIWSLLVMLGRLLDGHHYISDLATGALISILSVNLTAYFIYRIDKEKTLDDKVMDENIESKNI